MFHQLSMLTLTVSMACLLNTNAFITTKPGSQIHVGSASSVGATMLKPFSPTSLLAIKEPNIKNSDLTIEEQNRLAQTFGGYTVKQRLREEVESPFRKVRLIFFASSAGSALTALYFSALSALKANMGGFSDAPPLDEALTNCAINIAGAVVCGYFAYRDYQVGQVNLERIAKGGQLAKLAVSPADAKMESSMRTLSDYRRNSRVLICAGGKEYIQEMCKSLNADQLSDTNNLPELLEEIDMLVVPVLLESNGQNVGDSKATWRETFVEEGDTSNRNFDSTRSDNVVAFPMGNSAWTDYLKSEIETAQKQGFDVSSQGVTITVKKNGKILRRATGAPSWSDLVGTMEVLDGSKFGMPGDN